MHTPAPEIAMQTEPPGQSLAVVQVWEQ